MTPLPQALILVGLGLVVGGFGTLIGAGGGFILVPILIFLYPDAPAEVITSISLAVVFANAASGTFAYSRLRRIDYQSGVLFALAAIPGAILGALSTAYIPRRTFDGVFGVALLLTGLALLIWPEQRPNVGMLNGGSIRRTVTESDGTTHEYAFNPRIGVALSVVAGYLSSMLGIGGGVLHVPAMVFLLGFPIHVATATSHFVLSFMALAGTVTHVTRGTLAGVWEPTLLLGGGVVLGAQVGAVLSNRMHGTVIIRGLATALVIVGVRIALLAL